MRPDQDPLAEFDASSLPDTVPDELVRRYGRQAGHSVRYTRSRRYRVRRGMSRASVPLRSSNVWVLATMIFFWAVIGAAMIGALVYAMVLWPSVGLYVLVPVLGLFVISLGVAAWMTKHRPMSSDDIEIIP